MLELASSFNGTSLFIERITDELSSFQGRYLADNFLEMKVERLIQGETDSNVAMMKLKLPCKNENFGKLVSYTMNLTASQ